MRLLPPRRAGLLGLVTAALVTAGLATPAGAPSAPARSAKPAADQALALAAATGTLPAAPIGHAGRWLTDATGRVFMAAGTNMVYKLAPYTPEAAGFNAADAAFLAANGFNAVRLGVLWEAVEPEPGVFNDSYLAQIADTVRMLGGYGIMSLLDFHQDMYNEEFQGEGEPGWAVDDDGLPAWPELGFPGNYFGQLALQVAYDNFWSNAAGPTGVGLQDMYAQAWAHVAAYFDGNPDVLGYDLYNEPFPGTGIAACLVPLIGCPSQDATLTSFYRLVTTAIRQADPDTMVFDEPWLTFDIGYPTALGSTGDADTGFSFHDYCPLDSITSSLNLACPPFNDAVFNNANDVSTRTGDALLLTEFGATNDATELSTVVALADQYRVGYMFWAFCGCGDPTGSPATEGLVANPALAPTGGNVNQAMLDALAVPHPELVAGTPQSYGFSTATGTFTLDYSTERADGTGTFPGGSLTTVVVPSIQYPNGYQVVVSGASVVSATGVLELASCPGDTSVTVTVKPGSGLQNSC
jgi:endoglycosylceramidase